MNDVGEIRPSQLLSTFGIGALLDLPHLSAMVLGLDQWNRTQCPPLSDERLLAAVRRRLGSQVAELRMPPIDPDKDRRPAFSRDIPSGVPVASFPRWMLCPSCRNLIPLEGALLQLRTDPMRPDRAHYVHTHCERGHGRAPTVVPARFLVACAQGHLDDFPWSYFVHRGPAPATCGGLLRLEEYGVSGEAADIYVRCMACQDIRPRPLSDAFGAAAGVSLPACRGRHPHLQTYSDEPCSEPLKTISLGASNSWFGVMLSALSLPQSASRLDILVREQWANLQFATDLPVITYMRNTAGLNAFTDYSDVEVFNAVTRARQGAAAIQDTSLKGPEWRTLINPAVHAAQSEQQFRAYAVPPAADYSAVLEQVVLIERLREVRALLGFTRLAAIDDGEDPDSVAFTHLSRHPSVWVPATEVHGEGIFLQFNEDVLAEWLARPALVAHQQSFQAAHRHWCSQRRLDPERNNPGLRFVFLHTLAHALIRQLALACGYALASIRERIYAQNPDEPGGAMAGILLYTAAADSEGTLGGLVHLGRPQELARHLDLALEAMHLCASDPLCAEHSPGSEPGVLHGAACHACMFLPETSCERGNRYLDRSLLVPTVETDQLAFWSQR